MKTFMIILFVFIAVVWLLWLIGFPIYKNCIKKEPLWGFVLCVSSLLHGTYYEFN